MKRVQIREKKREEDRPPSIHSPSLQGLGEKERGGETEEGVFRSDVVAVYPGEGKEKELGKKDTQTESV